jgi:hypothetical protein
LLDFFGEKLDLPAVFDNIGAGFGAQPEVIGQMGIMPS